MYLFPEVKGKQMLPRGEHCQLWGDSRAGGLAGQRGWFCWAPGAAPSGHKTKALPSSWSVLLWPNTASMLSLINIPHASKPSAFFQLTPQPRTVGSSSSKCQTLAISPLFLSLLGSLGCRASNKGYSCKEGSDKWKSCSSVSIRNRPASQKLSKKLLYISEVLFKAKIEKCLYREQLL